MALKLMYLGQNDSVNCTPAVALIGDPGTDQQTLTNAGYLGGKIMALTATTTGYTPTGYTIQSANEPAFGAIGNIVPCDPASTAGNVPFAVLLNGPGEFAGAIGPSGSKKAPVVRAMFQGMVTAEAYDSNISITVGQYLYCGGSNASNVGKWTDTSHKGTGATAIGICTHVPSASEPWLGVASLI